VFWQVGSSATVGTGTVFVGSVLALASITLTTGAKVSGRALARTGAVTMDDNAVALPICAKAPASDAGVADAAPASDAGATDAAHADTGTDAGLDAGAPADAGSTDAGTADAATSDAGAGDAATN
jgi:hypothetical protein